MISLHSLCLVSPLPPVYSSFALNFHGHIFALGKRQESVEGKQLLCYECEYEVDYITGLDSKT